MNIFSVVLGWTVGDHIVFYFLLKIGIYLRFHKYYRALRQRKLLKFYYQQEIKESIIFIQ